MPPRILIVEDDSGLLQLTGLMLTRSGYEVRLAESAEEALRTMNEFRPDMFIVDVLMPGMSGIEFCATIRQKPGMQQIPLLVLSGKREPELIEQSLRAGANDYLTKPVLMSVLVAKVGAFLNSRAAIP